VPSPATRRSGSGNLFGTSAEFWLHLQKLYELRVAERESGKAVKALPTLADRRNRSRTGRQGLDIMVRHGEAGHDV